MLVILEGLCPIEGGFATETEDQRLEFWLAPVELLEANELPDVFPICFRLAPRGGSSGMKFERYQVFRTRQGHLVSENLMILRCSCEQFPGASIHKHEINRREVF